MALQTGVMRGPHAVVSAVQRWDGRIGVGVVLRGRGGVSLEKHCYVAEAADTEEALYRALLETLNDAADRSLRGLAVLVDDATVVDELNRQIPVSDRLRSWFVQVRCRANSLWPTRFEVAKPAQALPARQLAQDALEHGMVMHRAGVTPLLPLRFAEERVA
jgi:hypothetical protein